MKKLLLLCCTLICLVSFIAFAVAETPVAGGVLTVADQEAVDGKISVSYELNEEGANAGYTALRADVYHGDNFICSTDLEIADANESKQASVETTYGKVIVKLIGIKENGETEEIAVAEAAVWSDAYNITSLNATFPVVYFTLDLFSMNESEDAPGAFMQSEKSLPIMDNVPTFVSLERTAAYNWDELPENVSIYPTISVDENIQLGFHAKNDRIAAYVKELYEIHPESTFHFYCVDNYPELVLKFFTAQGIPDESFQATLISDGTATVSYFKAAFGGANGKEVYDKMVEEWHRIKGLAAAGDSTYLDDVYLGSGTFYQILAKYALVMITEEDNVELWCSRNLFTSNTESVYIQDLISGENESGENAEGKKANFRVLGINDMLSILNDEQQTDLKALFHFDSEMFSAAEEENKKVLMVVGTSTANEGQLEAYLTVLNAIHGDEYKIYYKGHPGYPTGLYEEKVEMFGKLGITDLEASIAAELIMFYCPDIYLSGYGSTTYKSAQEGKFLDLFAYNKEDGLAMAESNGYGDMPDTFFVMDETGRYVIVESAADDTVKYFDTETNDWVDSI